MGVGLFAQHADVIDVVLMDLTTGGSVGTDTLSALRALRPQVRVILTSGGGEPPGLAVGPVFFVQKPYDIVELRTALRCALAGCARRVGSP